MTECVDCWIDLRSIFLIVCYLSRYCWWESKLDTNRYECDNARCMLAWRLYNIYILLKFFFFVFFNYHFQIICIWAVILQWNLLYLVYLFVNTSVVDCRTEGRMSCWPVKRPSLKLQMFKITRIIFMLIIVNVCETVLCESWIR